MAKISFVLVFALALALPFHSVLGQDDSWKDLISQGGFGGLSQETLDQAKKALEGAGDAAVADAAANAVGGPVNGLLGDADDGEGASLTDWVSSVKDGSKAPSSSPGSPANAPDWPADEADLFTDMVGDTPTTAEAPEEDYPAGAPESAPTKAPVSSPTKAPSEAPEQAPTDAPVEAPELAPTDAPAEGPAAGGEEEEEESGEGDWASEGAPDMAPVESPLDDGEEEPMTVWPPSPADAPPEPADGTALDELYQDLE